MVDGLNESGESYVKKVYLHCKSESTVGLVRVSGWILIKSVVLVGLNPVKKQLAGDLGRC